METLFIGLSFLANAFVVGESPCVWRREAMTCVFVIKDSVPYAVVLNGELKAKYVLRKHKGVMYEVWTYNRVKS